MKTYERVNLQMGTSREYLLWTENALFIYLFFFFALESEKMAMISGLLWYLKNDSIFPFLLFFL